MNAVKKVLECTGQDTEKLERVLGIEGYRYLCCHGNGVESTSFISLEDGEIRGDVSRVLEVLNETLLLEKPIPLSRISDAYKKHGSVHGLGYVSGNFTILRGGSNENMFLTHANSHIEMNLRKLIRGNDLKRFIIETL
jgi:hypothetical protein